MLRIHGDRNSLLAALAAHCADQQLKAQSSDGLTRPPVCNIRHTSGLASELG